MITIASLRHPTVQRGLHQAMLLAQAHESRARTSNIHASGNCGITHYKSITIVYERDRFSSRFRFFKCDSSVFDIKLDSTIKRALKTHSISTEDLFKLDLEFSYVLSGKGNRAQHLTVREDHNNSSTSLLAGNPRGIYDPSNVQPERKL